MNDRSHSTATIGSTTAAPHPDLAVLVDPDGVEANAVRALRASIRFAGGDHPPRTVLLACLNGAGRAGWLAANLAASFGLGGDRTVLLDANLRQPRLHEYFGISNGSGVTNFLLQDTSSMPLTATAVAGLSLIPAGPPPHDAAVTLTSPRFATLLQRLRENADFVIIEASPLATSADVLGIAPLVDGVVLVVRAGKTRRPAAVRGKEQLERIGAKLLGVALTDVPRQRGNAGY